MKLDGARWLSTWIGLRYLRTQRRQFVSLITWVSIVGLALGVAMLVVVSSVMNGFDAELKRRILGLVPQAVVVPPKRQSTIDSATVGLFQAPGRSVFRFFESDGMLARGGAVVPIAVYGIGAEGHTALDVLTASMVEGEVESLTDSPGNMIVGRPLARSLGLQLGDSLVVVLSRTSGVSVVPQLERFTLAGTFEVGAEIDYGVVLVDFDEIEARGLSSTGTIGVRAVIADPLEIAPLRTALEQRAPPGWLVRDWRSSYGALFNAVRLEKGMMFLLLLLIVAIAAFNIVSAQSMLVNDKRADIAILRTMGANDTTLVRMVLIQGVIVAIVGVGIGLGFGLLLALNATEAVAILEALIGARLLEGSYFDELPVLIRLTDVAAILGLSLLLCVVSAVVPARRAAAVNPAVALHEA